MVLLVYAGGGTVHFVAFIRNKKNIHQKNVSYSCVARCVLYCTASGDSFFPRQLADDSSSSWDIGSFRCEMKYSVPEAPCRKNTLPVLVPRAFFGAHAFLPHFVFVVGLTEKDWDMPWLGIGDPSRSGSRRDAKNGRMKLNAAIAADRVSASGSGVYLSLIHI